ncbi:MAG: hypothetical protein IPK88_16190 [Saprospiraceae bacterium]|nr:hypothetical protein [Candidatus Defluviibacterium haderslevense]
MSWTSPIFLGWTGLKMEDVIRLNPPKSSLGKGGLFMQRSNKKKYPKCSPIFSSWTGLKWEDFIRLNPPKSSLGKGGLFMQRSNKKKYPKCSLGETT